LEQYTFSIITYHTLWWIHRDSKIYVTIQSILGYNIIKKEIIDNKIDISELASGVYVITLKIDSNVYNYKIIKK